MSQPADIPEPDRDSGDTPMTSSYIWALVLEGAIFVFLWILGRVYS
jgi:hypothetical protein